MATVKVLVTTDMGTGIPVSSQNSTSFINLGSNTELDVSLANGVNFYLYGSFPNGFNLPETITRALIDTTDNGSGPNLDITDLNFSPTTEASSAISSNAGQFLLDMLSGDDTFFGSTGADTIIGFAGNDTIFGGLGADTMFGSTGNDFYFVDNIGDAVLELIGQGSSDRVFASTSWNMAQFQEIETLSTANQAGTEAINLRGNDFNNFVVGNDGQNFIAGGLGNDNLVGLGGNDFFLFEQAPGNSNADYVVDFTVGQDHILLQRSGGYASLAAGTLADGNFLVRGTAFQDANDFIIYDPGSGVLSYDADGSGASAAQAIALLTANLNLHASDIIAV